MSEGARAAARSSRSKPIAMESFKPRSSRRLAGEKPELEVIRRSRFNSGKHYIPSIADYDLTVSNEWVGDDIPVEQVQQDPFYIDDGQDSLPSDFTGNIEEPDIDNEVNGVISMPNIEEIHEGTPMETKEVVSIDSDEKNGASSESSKEESSTQVDGIDATYDDQFWTNYLNKLGIKKLHFTIEPEFLTKEEEHEECMIMEAPSAASSSKNGKKSNKKSKASKNKIIKESIEETEEDVYAKHVRERKNDLEAIRALKESLTLVNSILNSQNGPALAALCRICTDFIEEITSDVVHDTYQSMLSGNIPITVTSTSDAPAAAFASSGTDVFGIPQNQNKPDSFLCDNHCGRIISSNRYAPHLQKCTSNAVWQPSS